MHTNAIAESRMLEHSYGENMGKNLPRSTDVITAILLMWLIFK